MKAFLTAVVMLATPAAAGVASQQQPDAHKARQSAGMVLRQVWAGPDLTTSVSPDGRFLAYQDSSADLALWDLTTGESRKVTHKGTWVDSPESAWTPRFSRDGRRLTYAWMNRDFVYDLRVIDVDGSNERVLYRDESLIIYPSAWFPDGSAVLAQVYTQGRMGEGVGQIARVSTVDSSLQVLTTVSGMKNWVMSLSPDGRFVAYSAPPTSEDEKLDIYVYAIDTGHEMPLIQHPAHDADAVWAPDGNQVLFSSDRRGSQDLWAIDVADGEPQGAPFLVKRHIEQLWPLGFTADGSYFYQVWYQWSDLFVAELDVTRGGFVAPPTDVSHRSPGPSGLPAWSPDGKHLAYVSDRSSMPFGGSSTVLSIRSLETGDEREIPLDVAVFLGGAWTFWSADGDSLFIKRRFADLFRVDVHTGDVARSDLLPLLAGSVAWATDGKRLFYSVFDDGSQIGQTGSVVVRDTDNGTERTLYHGPAPSDLAVSPDGGSLAFGVVEYSPKRGRLVVVPTEGGEPRELDSFESDLSALGWTQEGNGLIYAKRTAAGYELWCIPELGEQPRHLEPTIKLRGFRLHPDGRRLAFAVDDSRLEVWVLEDFLPLTKDEW